MIYDSSSHVSTKVDKKLASWCKNSLEYINTQVYSKLINCRNRV